MRILLLQSSVYIPSLGGANKANRLLLEQLAARGHDCHVIGTAGEGRVESTVFRHAGVTVEAVLDGARLRARAAASLRHLAPDRVLVSSEDPAQMLLREAVNRDGGGAVVYIAHTTPHLPCGPDGFLASSTGTALLRRASGIIAVSGFVQGYLRRHAGLDSTVLRFPVYGDGPFCRRAGFGRGAITLINPCVVKGISIFLALARRCPDLPFAAVPTWGTTPEDRAALAALPNVEILEPTADVDRIFARCSVLLVPSLWSEAFGQVAVEAMLRGVPVLVSDAGGLPEAALGVGRVLPVRPIRSYEERFDERKIPVAVVPEQDAGPWEAALRETLADRESYEALSDASRKAALAFVSGLGIEPFERYLAGLAPEPPRPADEPRLKLSGLSPEKLELLARWLKKKEGEAVPGIPRLPRCGSSAGDRFPLSFAQQRLWFLDRLEPGSLSYNEQLVVRLTGRLEARRLAAALDRVVRRHEVLRTTYAEDGDEPVQIVHPPEDRLELPFVDLGALPEPLRRAAATGLATAGSRRAFDLGKGPVMRAVLLGLGAEECLLSITAHHIAVDNWSASVLFAELSALYGALATRELPALSELPVQVADFAVWQRGWLTRERLEEQLGFWRGQLAGAPALIDLPTDRPRPAHRSFHGARETAFYPAHLAVALRALARQRDVTPYMLLLAAFQALLHRITGQDDLVVGTPVAGRTRREIEPLIGFFLNTLPMRTRIARDLRFPALLDGVRRTALDAFAHQDLPFERLVEALAPERSLSHPPLFQVLFNFLNVPPRTEELAGGARLTAVPVQTATTRFDLELYMEEQDGGLAAALVYSTDLFDTATAARLLGHLEILLAGVAGRPGDTVSELPLLTPAELHQLQREHNDTGDGRGEPGHPCVDQLFAAQARRTPDAPAVTCGGQTLTYAELAGRADWLARRLRALGCGPEARVGIALERALEMPAALLGVLAAGAAYVPLDPGYPRERLALVLEDAAPRVLITREHLLPALPPFAGTVLCLDGEPSAGSPDGGAPMDGDDRRLAYVLYTSGSTGRPKGVGVPHRSLVAFLGAMRRAPGFAPGERLLAVTSLAFDIAALEVFLPLTTGGCVELAGQEEAQDGVRLADRLRTSGAGVLQATPTTWRMLLDAGWAGDPGLVALCGGEALPRDLAASLAGRTRALWNLYGPTETTVWSAAARIDPEEAGPVSIGPPIAGTRIHLLDRQLRTVPLGVPGELWIGGAGLARGYLGRPDLTAERFVPDPLADEMGEPGGRLYRTGDLARHLPGGRMEILGRIDHQVKLRGIRIEPGEIEAALARHPGIREAVVVLRRDPPGERLVAYLVPAGEPAPGADELRGFLRQSLPAPMIPTAFVALAALPLTPNRKVDRRALPAPEPVPEPDDAVTTPRTPAEEVVAGIWAQVLGRDRIGIRDSFFDLGGHSLLAMRVMSRLRSVLGVELPLRALFERPSVAELTEAVEEARRGVAGRAAPPLVPVPRAEYLPLSFAQEGLWFLDRLQPGSSAYNIAAVLALSGPLDLRALTAAWGELLQRQEALRTTFAETGGRPVQRISPPAAASPIIIPVVDLTALAGGPLQATAERLTAAEARRPFDLSRGPLVRLTVLRLGDAKHRVVLCIHHIIADGWSMAVLVRELTSLYTARVRGTAAPLPELPVQYADYGLWQRGRLSGDVLAAELAWWREKLAGAPPLLKQLPLGRLLPGPDRRAGQVVLGLPEETAGALEALSRRSGATLFMTLLAGWSALLARYTAREDVLIGSPVAGRTRPETESLIGLFVNPLALRMDLSGDPGFDGLVARVRGVTLDAYDHQELPFGRLVQEMQPARSLAHSPLVQVFFVLQNVPRAVFDLPGLRPELLPVPPETAKSDLTLTLERREAGLSAVLEFRRDWCDAATGQRFLEHWRKLLDGVVAAPAARLSELPRLAAVERAELLSAPKGRVPPRTPLEEVLSGMMAEALKLDEVGVFDDFFGLGGNSLLALEMLSLMRETFGIEVSVARVFETPTVAGLAAYLIEEPDRRRRIDAVMPVLLAMAGEAPAQG